MIERYRKIELTNGCLHCGTSIEDEEERIDIDIVTTTNWTPFPKNPTNLPL